MQKYFPVYWGLSKPTMVGDLPFESHLNFDVQIDPTRSTQACEILLLHSFTLFPIKHSLKTKNTQALEK